jgi:hypothetical protein
MAAVSITAANVGIGDGATIEILEVGETVTHGEVLYFDSANVDYRLADADVESTAKAKGISVTSAAADGSFVVAVTRGPLVLGGGLTQGVEYYLGTTPGEIVPKADLVTGDYVTRLGIASSTTVLQVDIRVTGVTV